MSMLYVCMCVCFVCACIVYVHVCMHVRVYVCMYAGHSRAFVREFAGVSLSFLLRKIKASKALKAHVRGLVTALGDSTAQRKTREPVTRTSNVGTIVCVCVCMHACMYVCVCMYVCMYVCM